MVELAWLWQRYQPGAAQVAWFRDRVGSTGRRIRKVMVVALARKLLIALWRFVIDGVMPEGAVVKLLHPNRRRNRAALRRHWQSGDPRERRRSSAWRLARRLKEWCRSFEALPSPGMRDSGRGSVIPPDVRLAGDALRERELTPRIAIGRKAIDGGSPHVRPKT